ncbi:MAG: hypothetical protein VZS44_05920 [Bacilli bacterium]|nr:hypothetical protein [Bacilli bacterium]
MENNTIINKNNTNKKPTKSEELVISTANLLNQINVPKELNNTKQKILERKDKIEKNRIDRR